MEQTVPLHLQQLVPVFGLLNAPLEFNQLTSGWLDVECHVLCLQICLPSSSLVVRVVLVDPLLVKSYEVLGVD